MNNKGIVTRLTEAIAVTIRDDRYQQYFDLVGKRFQLGPSWNITVLGRENKYVTAYGPTKNRLLKDKYVYLIMNKSPKTNKILITHFYVSDKELGKNSFKWQGDTPYVEGKKAMPIPDEFVKMEHVFSLIVAAGVTADDKSKGVDAEIKKDPVMEFDINERFNLMKHLVAMVAAKSQKGLIITGTGGVGKTYTVTETLENMGLKAITPNMNTSPDEDLTEEEEEKEIKKAKSVKSPPNSYIHVMGAKLTPVSFYTLLHENRDSFILFDDSDSVLMNPDIINMLKAALESGDKPRVVSYMSSAISNQGMDTSFEFTGRLIFISNLRMSDLDQPIRTRVNTIDVSMTRDETFMRMQYIVDTYKSDQVKHAFYQEALDQMMKIDQETRGSSPSNLSMRLLDNVVATLASPDSLFGGDSEAAMKAKMNTVRYQLLNA